MAGLAQTLLLFQRRPLASAGCFDSPARPIDYLAGPTSGTWRAQFESPSDRSHGFWDSLVSVCTASVCDGEDGAKNP